MQRRGSGAHAGAPSPDRRRDFIAAFIRADSTRFIAQHHAGAAGALDVWFTPIVMKKNRPGVTLGVLCEEGVRDALADIILTETTAFGVRVERIHRLKLARRMKLVATPYGEVQIKLGLKGGRVVLVAPEFDSVRAASEASGIPLRTVHEAAVAAWRERAAGSGPDELA